MTSSNLRFCMSDDIADVDDDDLSPVPGEEMFTMGYGSSDEDGRKIKLGICAMAKKVKSRPMQEILRRLAYFGFLDIIIFEEEAIKNMVVDEWPIVDCIICFHSAGFPLNKAIEYDQLRKPLNINELKMQFKLMDRRIVHRILEEQGILQPKYAIMDRDKGSATPGVLIEHEDSIEVNGVVFHKPFVEKPVSAEDHNVYIYYPSSAGGGSQRLFRKIGSRSSVYSPVSRVRTAGSYIYEEFMPTDGTDVKVYTVGADYAHAEARKSPALDGKVERDQNGKEVRYPVILSAHEKLIARRVCLAFKQTVCGFDLLRANGVSYVCDVNGFSFVKTSSKYYDDCASVLGSLVLRELAPQLSLPIPPELAGPEVAPIVPTTFGAMMELRCVIAVIRHGDRTPKQKMKMEVKHKRFFDLFEKYGGYAAGQLKLKQPKQLQEVLDISRALLDEIESHSAHVEVEEKKAKLLQLKSVLEMYGHFSGINRKIQLKYQPMGYCGHNASSAEEVDAPHEPSLVLILKWGGELTPAGKQQAEELGRAFRCMYPSYGETPGLGLLRLHSTFRHDLKIYASDEGRVQMTAAAFAKGFLALDGELTPILVQMVKSGSHTNGLLDNADEAQPLQRQAKQVLQECLNEDRNWTMEDFRKICPDECISTERAFNQISNPSQTFTDIHELCGQLLKKIKALKVNPKTADMALYHGESLELMWRRWWKLNKDFRQKNGQYDFSKIPDIYDNIKYDLQHNGTILDMEEAEILYAKSKALADIIIPQEYGLSKMDKLRISANIASPLLRKIKADLLTNAHESEDTYTRLDSSAIRKESALLGTDGAIPVHVGSSRSQKDQRFSMGVSSPDRHVRTRLYFTSESHAHSLLSLIKHGGLAEECDDQWSRALEFISSVAELNYMTQIVIMMYEDPKKEKNSDERFHIEIHFSPGAYGVQGDHTHEIHGGGYRPNQCHEKGSPVPSPSSDAHLDHHVQSDEDTHSRRDSSPDCETHARKAESCESLVLGSRDTTNSIIDEAEETLSPLLPHPPSTPIAVKYSKVRRERRVNLIKPKSMESLIVNASCLGCVSETSAFLVPDTNAHGKRHHSISAGLHHCSPTGSALISTKVISGSQSAPNLKDMDENRALEAYGMAVPEIMPLETLHNSLNLKEFERFLNHAISMATTSPKRSCGTMVASQTGSLGCMVPLPQLTNKHHDHHLHSLSCFSSHSESSLNKKVPGIGDLYQDLNDNSIGMGRCAHAVQTNRPSFSSSLPSVMESYSSCVEGESAPFQFDMAASSLDQSFSSSDPLERLQETDWLSQS